MNTKSKNKIHITKSFEEYAKKILSTKENSQKFLKELGTHDKKGKLTKHYR